MRSGYPQYSLATAPAAADLTGDQEKNPCNFRIATMAPLSSGNGAINTQPLD